MDLDHRRQPSQRVWVVLATLTVCASASIAWTRKSDHVPVKIPVQFARADFIGAGLGGAIADPQPGVSEQFALDAPMQTLLPDGIDSVIAYNRDNTLLVRGTDEGIAELKKIVQQFDVPARHVRLAVALRVTVTDQQGHVHAGSLDANSSAIGGESLVFRTQRQGLTPLPHETTALMKGQRSSSGPI